MTEPNLNDLHGYQAAQEGAAYLRLDHAGYLRISGPDRIAYIQRQTTNDVNRIGPETALLTVLTSPTARILDVWYLVQDGEAIGVLPLPGHRATTLKYLQGRIFFMDKVTVEDMSDAYAQYALLGPQSISILKALGLVNPPAIHSLVAVPFGESALRVMATGGSFGPGDRLIVPAGAAADLEQELDRAGAVRLSPQAYEVIRIEAGLPEAGHELTENYTPLETGLSMAVAEGKGCYTGQEVLARQTTYDKVTQLLRGLRLSGEVAPGDRVTLDSKPAGSITSYTYSPRFGPIALAVLKKAAIEPGTAVRVGPDSKEAIVSSLPFGSATQPAGSE